MRDDLGALQKSRQRRLNPFIAGLFCVTDYTVYKAGITHSLNPFIAGLFCVTLGTTLLSANQARLNPFIAGLFCVTAALRDLRDAVGS